MPPRRPSASGKAPARPSGHASDAVVFDLAIARALKSGAPVVALETALLSLGLPYPQNVEVFEAMVAAVEESGAKAAGIALHEGCVHIGLSPELVQHMARSTTVKKCARRDIGWVLATGITGATTVSSTLHLAQAAGIRVFATGGIGGVHPQVHGDGTSGPPDISADLVALSEISMIIVSTGVKSICDAAATAELLEALSVPVIGYGTDRFPHFYAGESPVAIPRIESAADAARAYRAARAAGIPGTTFVANPSPAEHRLDPEFLQRLNALGGEAAHSARVSGNALTPFLLDYLATHTNGRSVVANRALLVSNARVAGQIAVELARQESGRSPLVRPAGSRPAGVRAAAATRAAGPASAARGSTARPSPASGSSRPSRTRRS